MEYHCTANALQRFAGRLSVLGLVLLLVLSTGSIHAQGPDDEDQPREETLEAQLRAGVRALDAEDFGRAESLLVDVCEAEAAYISPQHGAAAYWLGTAYERQEETKQAHQTWIDGQRAVAEADAFDVRLADAYLRALFATDLRTERLAAADVYLQLLSHADSTLVPAETEIVHRHVAQSALLFDDARRERLSDGSLHDETWTVKEDAGGYLVAWWQRQDRAPATPENERLEEHLHRVAEARAQYAYDERVSGLDDRGETYVRYGPPYQQRSIEYNDAGFFRDVFRFGVNVASFDFPDNELWTYPHIHHAAYFVFVEDNGLFKIGSSSDLLPSRLSNVFSNSERHLNRAVSALAAMRYIYRDLALYHSDFSSLYNDVDNYANWQEMNEKSFELTGEAPAGMVVRQVGHGVGQQRLVFADPSMGIDLPSRFVQRKAQEQKTVDYHAERARREVMPPQHSELFAGVDTLTLSVRTARFLNPNGTTRTEVYWGTLAQHLHQPEEEDASLIKLTAVRYDGDYSRQGADNQWYDTDIPPGDDGLVVPGTFTVNSAADPFHLALQWEQYEGTAEGGHIQLGKQLRVATHRVDTLAALDTNERQLEMSDLRPMLPDDERGAGAAMAPYPFETIAPEASLLLYFELYHLGFGGDDRTQYTVEYDVQRRTQRGGLARLFRGDDEQRTTASTTYEGNSRTSEEQILIDLSDWENDRAGEIIVTVRVTDETTGQQAERNIAFDVVPNQ